MPQKRRLLVSAFTNWLAFAATLMVSFFLSPYLIGKLGDSRYGVWVFVESIIAYFMLFDLGIAAGVVRFTAKYHAQKNQHELNRLASACLALFVGLGALAFLVGLALTPVLSPMMSKSGMPTGEISVFTLLMLGNLALSLPLGVFPAILDGLERFAVKSLVRTVFLAGRTVAIVMLMERDQSLIGLAVIFTIGTLAEHFVLAILCWVYLPRLRFGLSLIDREMLRRVKGYSLDAFLAMIASRVSVQSGAIVIGIFLSAPEITWFAIALRLVDFAKALLRSATITLTPAISSLEAAGNIAAIRHVLLKGTRWVLYLIVPVQIGLVIFSKPFLTIWLGSPEYAVRCYSALVILSATLSLVVAQSVASRILYGMGRLRLFALGSLGEAALNLTMSLLLVRHLGIVGIAWASAIPSLLFCLFVIGYVCRLLRIRWRDYIGATTLRPMAAALVPLAIWLLGGWTINSWTSLMLAIGTGLSTYAFVVVALERLAIWNRRAVATKRVSFESATSIPAPTVHG